MGGGCDRGGVDDKQRTSQSTSSCEKATVLPPRVPAPSQSLPVGRVGAFSWAMYVLYSSLQSNRSVTGWCCLTSYKMRSNRGRFPGSNNQLDARTRDHSAQSPFTGHSLRTQNSRSRAEQEAGRAQPRSSRLEQDRCPPSAAISGIAAPVKSCSSTSRLWPRW